MLMANAPVTISPGETKRPPAQSSLDGPLVSTLLRFAAPNLIQILVQSAVAIVEIFLVGRLGTDAVAGISVVFPIVTLLIGITIVALGGAVASAIARSLGAGDKSEAEALALHAIIIAIVFGAISAAIFWTFDVVLYSALGVTGASLGQAIIYSNIFFGGSVSVWLLAVLTAIVRGTGDMVTAARIAIVRATIGIPLAAALIFGWGPIPALGIAGSAIAMLCYYSIGVVALVVHLQSRRSILHISLANVTLRWSLFERILKVGAISSLQIGVANLALVAVTGIVARFGTEALAGYGLASRIELLIFPVLLAFGVGTTTMVGTCVGAGLQERARKVALVATGIGAIAFEAIGLIVALFASGLIGLFSKAPNVVLAGANYLHTVGPVYGFMGLSAILFAAYQGWGRMTAPFLTSLLRLGVAILGGLVVVHSSKPQLGTMFVVIAGSTVLPALALGLFFLLRPPQASSKRPS